MGISIHHSGVDVGLGLSDADGTSAAAEIATYQTNTMWDECFGLLQQTGLTLADNSLQYGFEPGPTFTGDADIYALGDYGAPCISILKPGWHAVMSYAYSFDSTPAGSLFSCYTSCGTDNSAFFQGKYHNVMPGELMAVAGQVQAYDVIWVPPDDLPYFVVPTVWQKSGGTRTFDLWCGAWPLLVDED